MIINMMCFETPHPQGLANSHVRIQAQAFLAQPHRKATVSCDGPATTIWGMASQPTQPGPAPYQWGLRSLPYHNRRLHTVQIVSTPRAYSSGDQRGVCCWDPQDVSYVRLLLQDWKTQLTHLIHRNKENPAKMFQVKEQDKNLRRRIKQSRDSNLNDRVQSNDHKDAQQTWEKNGWTQWEFE